MQRLSDRWWFIDFTQDIASGDWVLSVNEILENDHIRLCLCSVTYTIYFHFYRIQFAGDFRRYPNLSLREREHNIWILTEIPKMYLFIQNSFRYAAFFESHLLTSVCNYTNNICGAATQTKSLTQPLKHMLRLSSKVTTKPKIIVLCCEIAPRL